MSKRTRLIVCMAYHLGSGGRLDRQTLKEYADKAGVSERTAYRAKHDVETTKMITL